MGRIALILGAGFGGIVTAQALRKTLPRDDRVVLVERAAEHVFAPSLIWLLVGQRDAPQISRPLAQLARGGIELVRGEISRIDPAARAVEVAGQTLRGDAIVIALGAEYDLSAVPGLAEAGHCLYTLEGATAARDALRGFDGGRIVVLTAVPQYKCPAAPYEAALLIDAELRKRGVRDRTDLAFHAAEPGPMMVAGPVVSAGVRGMIEARGISYHPEHQVASVDPAARRIAFRNGDAASFDLLFHVPPHRVTAAVREAGLTNESGWIPVDRHTLATRFEGVYAIGDIVVIPLKMGRPLPKAGVFAHGEGEVVAHNIAVAWTGHGAPKRFEGDGACFIETGGGRAGMGQGNFYAEPTPDVKLRAPSLLWHGAKVLYEKYWLYSRF